MLKDKNFNKLVQKNLKTICRLCLIGGPFLREICGTKISSMIQYCLDIKIVPQNQLPTHICARCFRQIMNFYTFKRKIEKNDHVLKKAISHKSETKDIINIALENSDINPSELNETQKADTIKSSIVKKVVTLINNDPVKVGDEFTESEKKAAHLYHKPVPRPVHYNEIQDLKVKLNPDSGTALCLNYIEPPPLVPLHSSSDSRNSDSILEDSKMDHSISKNMSTTSILQPPPLIPIIPVKVASEIVEGRLAISSTKLSCSVCRKEFESLTALREHKLDCRFNTNECNICKKSFTDRKKLIVHLKSHKITKEYLCNVCGKRYSSPSTFRVHLRSHTGERPFKCGLCDKGFARWAGVKNHMITHEDFKGYQCETCDKRFKVISNLYRHQRLHTGNYKFSCSFCSKAFSQSEQLKLHVRTYHTNDKPFLCCVCGKGFVSCQRLKRHELVHSDQKPYPCALCLRTYSQAVDLKNHNLRVHNKSGDTDEIKKYACPMCGLRFRYPCRLTKHVRTHADVNKNCQICGYNFKCVKALSTHLKVSDCKNVSQRA